MKQCAEREVAAAARTAPVPCAQSDGLAIYRFGQGEPVLFMPYPHAASVVGDPMPTAIIEELEQADRQVITFDPPGAGHSTRPARLDLEEMFDGAEEALQHCSVHGPVDVVGHSQGAFVALAFAIERPQRVRRLILIGAGAGGPSWMRAPGALWNRSHPEHWHWALWASVYQFTRRLAAQKLMFNVVSRSEPRSAAACVTAGLVPLCPPAHPMGAGRSPPRLPPAPRGSPCSDSCVDGMPGSADACGLRPRARRWDLQCPSCPLRAERTLPVPGGTRRLLGNCPCFPDSVNNSSRLRGYLT
jgi:pimeloyl-ACP methyl ester carboxylesterase